MDLPPRLLTAIADSRVKVCVGYPWWLRCVLARDVAAITLGRRVYVRKAMATAAFERLMRHELVHVRQVERHGLFLFLWKYSTEFLRHWRRLRSPSAAYMAISFEVEAYAAEGDCEAV